MNVLLIILLTFICTATVLTVLYFIDILKHKSVFIIMIILWSISFLLFIFVTYKFFNKKKDHPLTETA